MIEAKKLPKKIFTQDNISCDLRKHNKKFFPIMKNNEQIGEFSFFKMDLYLPITFLLKEIISQNDFINSYQIFSEIFNELNIQSNGILHIEYYTTNKEIKKELTRQSRIGRDALYTSYKDGKKIITHKNNNDFSEYFFRKNIMGNFFLIERNNKLFIINKKQKGDIIQNNIAFKAAPLKELPYQIDDIDKNIIDVRNVYLSNPYNANMFFSLSKYSGKKHYLLKQI